MRRLALAPLVALAACSSSQVIDSTDARRVDARPADAADPDATGSDAGLDAATDAATDAGPDPGCTIAAGDTPILDGNGDLAAYPPEQVLTPGAPLAATDRVAITWDPMYLYVTVQSGSFADAFKPLHVYLETGDLLAAPVPSTGKEYGNDTPFLPFTPTQLVAVRRTSDSGVGGPYNGVYLPGTPVTWSTRSHGLVTGTDVFASADGLTLSVRTPWQQLGGCPTTMRLAAHVVHGDVANDWKDTVPEGHTPWLAGGGDHYLIDLTGDPAIAGWSQP